MTYPDHRHASCECEDDEKHPCPYQQELYDDNEPYCTCCENCEYECGMNV